MKLWKSVHPEGSYLVMFKSCLFSFVCTLIFLKKLLYFLLYLCYQYFIQFFKNIAQNTMLLEELFNVKSQLNATMHFPNVTSPTIPRRLTNVLSKFINKFYISYIHIIDDIQSYMIN